jgi:hypothetical protein
MKTITLDISDQVYKSFRDFIETLPEGSIAVYENDPDNLTIEESREIYRLKKKADKGDFTDFEEWEEINKK